MGFCVGVCLASSDPNFSWERWIKAPWTQAGCTFHRLQCVFCSYGNASSRWTEFHQSETIKQPIRPPSLQNSAAVLKLMFHYTAQSQAGVSAHRCYSGYFCKTVFKSKCFTAASWILFSGSMGSHVTRLSKLSPSRLLKGLHHLSYLSQTLSVGFPCVSC